MFLKLNVEQTRVKPYACYCIWRTCLNQKDVMKHIVRKLALSQPSRCISLLRWIWEWLIYIVVKTCLGCCTSNLIQKFDSKLALLPFNSTSTELITSSDNSFLFVFLCKMSNVRCSLSQACQTMMQRLPRCQKLIACQMISRWMQRTRRCQ